MPTQLRLSPGSSTSLVASWAGAGGAAWLHFTLHNLLTQTVTTTLSARRGLTSFTFQHLRPGTRYWLGLSVTAGPYTVGGPNATAWTCEYDVQGWGRTLVALVFSLSLILVSETECLLPEPWVQRDIILLGCGQKPL